VSDQIVAPKRLQKHPDEVIYYVWDFVNLLGADETLLTIALQPVCLPAGLVFGAAVIIGTTVKGTISGGVDGTTYKTTVEASTSEGQTWAVSGILEVTT
jgi:hypothetical protein